jgi:MoaA/NifB/PqqE/SkfB family radical SAM enzyme
MRKLVIRGETRKIPPFPHHKDYVLRCNRFFAARNFFSFLFAAGWYQAFREIFNNTRYGCFIPRDLLIDPTSACNLACKGCWAADYRKKSELSFDKLDALLTEATRLGTIDILMSGGEPLIRKEDILRLCGKHRKLSFGAFTNGTLIDERFADEVARLGNLNLFISIEGFREQTDFRRGKGTYDKVMRAMDILRERDIGFAFSACYHSKNYEEVSGDAFLDYMQEKGAWFGWLFNYLPIGSDADTSLCCSAEQRALVMQRVNNYFKKHNFTLIDLMNSGHKAYGCVGAGNGFAHINANGDVEPCAFCHYSDANIHDMSLLEALRSPFFKRFREAKPFSHNMLRPCPMMDNPEDLIRVASKNGVRSTHLDCPESPAELAAKTRELAAEWEPVANELIKEVPKNEKRNFSLLTKLVLPRRGRAKKE